MHSIKDDSPLIILPYAHSQLYVETGPVLRLKCVFLAVFEECIHEGNVAESVCRVEDELALMDLTPQSP